MPLVLRIVDFRGILLLIPAKLFGGIGNDK
jgi:hypothetical protein